MHRLCFLALKAAALSAECRNVMHGKCDFLSECVRWLDALQHSRPAAGGAIGGGGVRGGSARLTHGPPRAPYQLPILHFLANVAAGGSDGQAAVAQAGPRAGTAGNLFEVMESMIRSSHAGEWMEEGGRWRRKGVDGRAKGNAEEAEEDCWLVLRFGLF